MSNNKPNYLMSGEAIENSIVLIRGRKVMLSPHLAEIYGVELRVLTQAVKRNIGRFPEDFMFRLTAEEVDVLRSQNVILEKTGPGKGRGGYSKYRG